MSNYHGYWFYHLRTDKTIQAKDVIEEYCILNCPQEYEGPFKNSSDAHLYRAAHPTAHEDFLKILKEMEEFCYGQCG